MYDVSVVIPNYNGIKYLEHCLEALEKQREVAFETIIVDNCSQDGSASLAKRSFHSAAICRWIRIMASAARSMKESKRQRLRL